VLAHALGGCLRDEADGRPAGLLSLAKDNHANLARVDVLTLQFPLGVGKRTRRSLENALAFVINIPMARTCFKRSDRALWTLNVGGHVLASKADTMFHVVLKTVMKECSVDKAIKLIAGGPVATMDFGGP
jgi:hypothetical protein